MAVSWLTNGGYESLTSPGMILQVNPLVIISNNPPNNPTRVPQATQERLEGKFQQAGMVKIWPSAFKGPLFFEEHANNCKVS